MDLATSDGTPSRAEFLYLLLSGIFLGALVITNVIAGKFFLLFGHALSCGIIAYPVTFLATDLISELYGKERASQVVKVGFWVSAFVAAVVVISNLAPTARETYVDGETFARVFGLTPGIVFGSMCAYLVAQLVDVRVFHYWRALTKGRHLWLRNNGSTVVSQLLDTCIVVTVTMVLWPLLDGNPATKPLETGVVLQLIVGQYLFKAAVALLDTPLFYLGTAWLAGWVGGTPRVQPAE
jgi:queuosine precursor transporter